MSVRLLRRWMVAALLVSVSGCARDSSAVVSPAYPYSAAFIGPRPRTFSLFPLRGDATQVALPVTFFGGATYSRDGSAIYGFERKHAGMLRVDVTTMQARIVPGTEDLRGAAGLALSGDGQTVIVSGRYNLAGASFCGLLEVRLKPPSRRALAQNTACQQQGDPLNAALSVWSNLSLSADGQRLLVHNNSGLSIVSVANGSITSLGDFAAGAWSPDGKWLAAVEASGRRSTILMDAASLKEVRTLGTSSAQWSPDSRYLLGMTSDFCGPYWFTLEVIDVGTGERLVVGSSRCRVNLSTTGWVRRAIPRP